MRLPHEWTDGDIAHSNCNCSKLISRCRGTSWATKQQLIPTKWLMPRGQLNSLLTLALLCCRWLARRVQLRYVYIKWTLRHSCVCACAPCRWTGLLPGSLSGQRICILNATHLLARSENENINPKQRKKTSKVLCDTYKHTCGYIHTRIYGVCNACASASVRCLCLCVRAFLGASAGFLPGRAGAFALLVPPCR